MSSGSFRSFFDRGVVQVIHLLTIALYINCFSGLQVFIINNTDLGPADIKKGSFAKRFDLHVKEPASTRDSHNSLRLGVLK